MVHFPLFFAIVFIFNLMWICLLSVKLIMVLILLVMII